MKRISILLSAIAIFSIATQAISATVMYSDELPPEYIQKFKNSQKVDYKQTLPLYNTEKSLEVKVYSPQKIKLKTVAVKENKVWVAKPSINVGTEIKFIVSEDVMKNGDIYIKKGTEAVGIVRNATVSQGILAPPSELQISLFETKDVSGKIVKLYGTILNEGKDLGYFTTFGYPSLKASIPKDKIYTLYAEK